MSCAHLITCITKFGTMENCWHNFHGQEVTVFFPTLVWSWKTSIFEIYNILKKLPYVAENQFPIFSQVFVQMHNYTFVWKFLAWIFHFFKNNWFYPSTCVISRSLKNYFWKFEIFILRDHNFQNDPTIMVFQESKD